MSDLFNMRRVKRTRKPHTCEYCGAVIPTASPALYEWGIYDDRPFSRYTCSECERYVYDFWNYVDGECGSDLLGEFAYWVELERIPHPTLTKEVVCGSCGKRTRVMRERFEYDGWDWCRECGEPVEESHGE